MWETEAQTGEIFDQGLLSLLQELLEHQLSARWCRNYSDGLSGRRQAKLPAVGAVVMNLSCFLTMGQPCQPLSPLLFWECGMALPTKISWAADTHSPWSPSISFPVEKGNGSFDQEVWKILKLA